MKRKAFILLAAAVAGVLLLTACTSSENEEMQAAGAGTASSTGSQTISGQSADGSSTGEYDSTVVGVSDTGANGTAGDTGSSDGTGTASDSSTVSSGDSTASGGDSTGSDSSVENVDASDTIVSGEFDGVYLGDAEDEDIWSGTYSDDDETVTVTYLDKETISFAFMQSGISGKATVDGTQAVYKGDDYHVVVFNIQGDVLTVEVASEEDYDVSGSPLIGTYTKDQEEPET